MKLPQRSELWLFDCGEGTQHQFLKSDLRTSQIRRIFITHMHGDHIFGLMGLLASCGLAGNVEQIDLYGPADLADYIKACRRYSHTHFAYPLRVHSVQPGVVFEDAEFTVTCQQLKHRIPAYGYRIIEHDRPGQFDAEQAKALGVPFGPLYGKLKMVSRSPSKMAAPSTGLIYAAPRKPGARSSTAPILSSATTPSLWPPMPMS